MSVRHQRAGDADRQAHRQVHLGNCGLIDPLGAPGAIRQWLVAQPYVHRRCQLLLSSHHRPGQFSQHRVVDVLVGGGSDLIEQVENPVLIRPGIRRQ